MIPVNQRIVPRYLYYGPLLRAVYGGVHITRLVDKTVIERLHCGTVTTEGDSAQNDESHV